VTPERLSRDRPSPDHTMLASFLNHRRLGIAVVVEGPTLSVFAGVAVSASRRPYTYPQVAQLTELVTIFEGRSSGQALSRRRSTPNNLRPSGCSARVWRTNSQSAGFDQDLCPVVADAARGPGLSGKIFPPDVLGGRPHRPADRAVARTGFAPCVHRQMVGLHAVLKASFGIGRSQSR